MIFRYVSWQFWLFLLIIIILILWLFSNDKRKNHEFIGITPLSAGINGSQLLDSNTLANISSQYYSPRPFQVTKQNDYYQNNSDYYGNNSDYYENNSDYYENNSDLSSQYYPNTFQETNNYQDNSTILEQHNKHFHNADNALNESNITHSNIIEIKDEIDQTPIIPLEDLRSQPKLDRLNEIVIPPITDNTFVSRGEDICKRTLETIYKKPFIKSRPNFLKNPETDRNLELDCYNQELGIAVEYNGEQHYKYPNRFHKSYQEFLNQVRRDRVKVDLCDANNVYLITVPYNVPLNLIPDYINYYLPENVASRLHQNQPEITIAEHEII